ncbi:MAG: hypothetical protein KDK99_13510 [Verrucomicrobiales bacterium]|nr:hypothetical protein [Verrucomicrobiales bacterium]
MTTLRRRWILALLAAAFAASAVLLSLEMAQREPFAWIRTKTTASSNAVSNQAETDENDAVASIEERPRERTEEEIAQALPEGLWQVDAETGQGLSRAVRRAGVWFPVFEPGSPNAATAALYQIPLSITSGTPPAAQSSQFYSTTFEAIGGHPPYRWSIQEASGQFQIDPTSGSLSGQSEQPGSLTLDVYVTDAAGTQDSASYQLVIRDPAASPLEILTTQLQDAVATQPWTQSLQAQGGVPPLQWKLLSDEAAGMSLDATGSLSQSHPQSGSYQIELQVTDAAQSSATTQLTWLVTQGLEITTPRLLPPGSPSLDYHFQMEARGGTPPYEWSLIDGSLPFSLTSGSWILQPDGLIFGTPGSTEGLHQPRIRVRDATGLEFSQVFELPLRQALVAVPGAGKIGLAWQPARVMAEIGPVDGFQITRDDPTGSILIDSGNGSNLVDHGLSPGATYRYTLHVIQGTMRTAYATAGATLLPMNPTRAVLGQTADPYADRVKRFTPLQSGGFGAAFVPGNVTGPPDGRSVDVPAQSESELVSLHAARATLPARSIGADPNFPEGGVITLEFTDNLVENGPGLDFTIFENAFFIRDATNSRTYRFMEPAVVSVALFEGEWHRFPIDVVPPAAGSSVNPYDPFYYSRGFAGRNPTTGSDPTNAAISGGDSFDLDDLGPTGLSWIRYIRIQSTGHRAILDDAGNDAVEHDPMGLLDQSGRASGFDLDAVAALHP